MTSVPWKHLRGRSSYSEIAYSTFVTDEIYTAAMLKNDLVRAGALISETFCDQNSKACEFYGTFEGREFSAGIDVNWKNTGGSRILFEADLLLLRNLMSALGVNEEECF